MPDVDPQALLQSPKFRALSGPDKIAIWKTVDPDFGNLSLQQQAITMARMVSPDPKRPPDQGVWRTLMQGVEGMLSIGPQTSPTDVISMGAGATANAVLEGQLAKNAWQNRQGHPVEAGLEATGHTIAAATPLVGPYVSEAMEDIGQGRPRQGITKLGVALTPAMLRKLPMPETPGIDIARNAAESVKGAAKGAAETTKGAFGEGARTMQQTPAKGYTKPLQKGAAFVKGAADYATRKPYGPEITKGQRVQQRLDLEPPQPNAARQRLAQARLNPPAQTPPAEISPAIQPPFKLTPPPGQTPPHPEPEQGQLDLQDRQSRMLPTPEQQTQQAYQFFSPNVREDMSFDEAQKVLNSDQQAHAHAINDDINKQVGHQGTAERAIGDTTSWGSENSIFQVLDNPTDYESVRYSAAVKGLQFRQKGVIPFMRQAGGPDSVYRLTVPGTPEQVRGVLDQYGLQFRTLVPKGDQTDVVLFDQGRQLGENVERLADHYDTNVQQTDGRGEIIEGKSGTRADAAREYQRIIDEYEKAFPDRQRYQRPGSAPRFPDPGSAQAEAEPGTEVTDPRQKNLEEKIPKPTSEESDEEEIDVGTNRRNLNQHLNATPELKARSRELAQQKFGKSRGDLSSAQLQEIWEEINTGKKWDPRHPDRNKSLSERAADRIAKQSGATAETSGEGSLLDQLHASLKQTGDEANERMRQPGHILDPGSLKMNVPANDIKDMGVWGAARIAQGATTFAKFSKQMLEDAGPAAEKIKPQLEKIWKEAQTVHDRMMERFVDTKLTSTTKLLNMYRAGEVGKDWYKYTRVELEQYFGKDAELFVDMLAATSPNTSVKANVAQALKAYQQYRTGQQFTGFMPAVIGNLDRLARYGQPPSGMKVSNFKENLFGNTEAVTVDRWMMRALGWPGKSLKDRQYQFFDAYITQVARKAGVEPRQMQAAVWKAIKDAEGREGDTGEAFEEVLKRNLEKKPELRALLAEINKKGAVSAGR